MRKMSEKETLLETIYNELHEIKGHLSNDRDFEGGVALGALMNSISIKYIAEKEKIEKEEDQRKKDNEDDDEDDAYDYEDLYHHKCDEFIELRERLIELRVKSNHIQMSLSQISNLLSKLYNEDKIFPDLRDHVRKTLVEFGSYTLGLDGRLVNEN